jgi:hypothetical protein
MMKMIFGALALAIAVPAAAQTAPATDPHAGHAQQKAMDHSMHQPGKHDCAECCDKMKQSGGKMDCMDNKGEAKPAAPQSEHEGHAH